MKKLAAVSIAVSISATVFGIGQPASANPTSWKLVGRNASDNTPYLYDENSVRQPNKDVFVMHVSSGGKVVACLADFEFSR